MENSIEYLFKLVGVKKKKKKSYVKLLSSFQNSNGPSCKGQGFLSQEYE